MRGNGTGVDKFECNEDYSAENLNEEKRRTLSAASALPTVVLSVDSIWKIVRDIFKLHEFA